MILSKQYIITRHQHLNDKTDCSLKLLIWNNAEYKLYLLQILKWVNKSLLSTYYKFILDFNSWDREPTEARPSWKK